MCDTRFIRLLFLVASAGMLIGCAGSQLTPQGLSESRLEKKIESQAEKDDFPTASESGL